MTELSIIVPAYNDLSNFIRTLQSLGPELRPEDEVIVIDSSTERSRVSDATVAASFVCPVKCIWMPPRGVYAAQNEGIRVATRNWIQIINSGDTMAAGARTEIGRAIANFPSTLIHVFRQAARSGENIEYIFSPTRNSIWPHQSVVVHCSVYRRCGLYSERYRLAADQIFFGTVRRKVRFALHEAVASEYLLGGMSSSVKIHHSREVYEVRRLLGQGVIAATWCSYLQPICRRILEWMIGEAHTARLKAKLFRNYRRERINCGPHDQ